MRTYHPIQWVENIHWHNVLADRRLWAVLGIVVFVTLFTLLVLFSVQSGSTSSPYWWPYGPYMPPSPIHMP